MKLVPTIRVALFFAIIIMLAWVLIICTDINQLELISLADIVISNTSKYFSRNKQILEKERLHLSYDFGGYLFNAIGKIYSVSTNITTSLVHSFTPYVEREAERRFIDPARDNVYFANSPAVLWYHDELIFVCRIWLDREKYEPKNDWPANHFADNFLYTQKFDDNLKPISDGYVMGIPSPKQWWVGDGPIEPRIFKVQDRVFVTFNAAMAFHVEDYLDYTIIWDYQRNLPIIPKIKGGTPMINATEHKTDMPRDKHWMALIKNDELYFVHNLDPFRVLHCQLDGFCEFVFKQKTKNQFIFQHSVSHLRGGTPFEHYEDDYYIGVAHSTMYKESNYHRFYAAHIVIVATEPWRIVYVSDDIKIHKEIYQQTPMVRYRWIEDGFIFPVGIILESPDNLILGVHVNDHSSILLRISGIRNLLKTIISLDRKAKTSQGPNEGYIQQHIHDELERLKKTAFVH